MFFLNMIIAVAIGLVGVLVGVRDCKQQFGIPKGVTAEEGEFVLWADVDEEVDNGNILDY